MWIYKKGVSMAAIITKFYLKIYRQIWHDIILKNKSELPDNQSIFTIYDLFPINGIKVVKNNQEQLKANIAKKSASSNLIHFLGAPFVERDGMNEADYIHWLKEIRGEFRPDADFVYILHPWESDEFALKVKNQVGAEIKRFGLPYELELMQMESIPSVISSWFCTALDNLSVIDSDDVNIISYRLPRFEDMNIRPKQKPIFDAAEEFYRRHSGDSSVQVRKIPEKNKTSKSIVENTLSDINKGLWKTPLLIVTLKSDDGTKDNVIDKAEAALNNLYFSSKNGGISTVLQPGESISEAIDRICLVIGVNDSKIFSSEGISENLIETWLDINGKRNYQLALDFIFTTKSKLQKIKEHIKEGLLGGIDSSKSTGMRISDRGHIEDHLTIFESPDNPDAFVNLVISNNDTPQELSKRIQGIKISILVVDNEKKILISERSRFPEKGYFGLPSLRLTRGMTLDIAFEELANSIFNFKLDRSFAEELAWLEVFSLQDNENSTEEHIIDLVYVLKIPSRHLVKLNSSTESKRLSWWDYKAFSMNPLISKSAEKLLPKILTKL